MTIVKHPWQTGPTELIQYAIKHLHSQSDFDKRIAYLLFDVGVETLFKTYLTLPDEFANTQMKFFERQQAAEGNFHELVRGVSKASGEKLKNVNLSHVQFYHELRNKLYHEGNGITIPFEKVHAYAEIATNLLKALLDIDLSDELQKPETEAKKQAEILELQNIAKKRHDLLDSKFRSLNNDLIVVLEKLAPKLTLPSFSRRFEEITKKYLVKYIAHVGDDEIPEYSYRMSDKPELVSQYQREVFDFLNTLIEEPTQRKIFFAVGKLPFSTTDVTIEKILFSIAQESYPEAESIQYQALELLLPEFENWARVLVEYNEPDYTLADPFINEIERWQKVTIKTDNLLNEMEKVRVEIRKWLQTH